MKNEYYLNDKKTARKYSSPGEDTVQGMEMGDLKKEHEVTPRTVRGENGNEERTGFIALTSWSLIIASSPEFHFPASEHLLPSSQLNFSSTVTEARL